MLKKQDPEAPVSSEKTIDEQSCPFCGAKNNCMAQSETPCWCSTETIPKTMQDMIPESTRGLSCVCLACIKAYQENPDNVIKANNRSQKS